MREKEEDLGGSEAWVDPVTSQVCLASALRLGVSASTPTKSFVPHYWSVHHRRTYSAPHIESDSRGFLTPVGRISFSTRFEGRQANYCPSYYCSTTVTGDSASILF